MVQNDGETHGPTHVGPSTEKRAGAGGGGLLSGGESYFGRNLAKCRQRFSPFAVVTELGQSVIIQQVVCLVLRGPTDYVAVSCVIFPNQNRHH